MAALEVLQNISQLDGNGLGIKRKNSVHNVIGASLVCRIEIAGLRRRFERPHNHPRRVRTQI
jgi:hypothetical protein